MKVKTNRGFTLIELMVVLAVVALLLTLAYPRYFSSIDKAKEAALRQDLALMRDALDKYYGDTGKHPRTLADLVQKGYLRAIPPDPITGSAATWQIIPPAAGQGGVFNVRSGAQGNGADGTPYAAW